MGFDNNKIILSLETEKKNWNGKKVRKIPPPPRKQEKLCGDRKQHLIVYALKKGEKKL